MVQIMQCLYLKELKDTISLVRTTELVLGNKNKKVLISENKIDLS